jgi:hypothetical protein
MMINFQGKTMGFLPYHETKTYNSATSGLPFLKARDVWSKIGPKHRFRLFVKSSYTPASGPRLLLRRLQRQPQAKEHLQQHL